MSIQVPTTTTTLPSFAAAAGMANNLGATTGEGVLSRLDGSDAAVGTVKGQNVADGDYDGVVVKVGLKFGRNSVVWGGNCSEFFFLFFSSPFFKFPTSPSPNHEEREGENRGGAKPPPPPPNTLFYSIMYESS